MKAAILDVIRRSLQRAAESEQDSAQASAHEGALHSSPGPLGAPDRSLAANSSDDLPPRPAVYPPRQPGSTEAEIDRFLEEIKLLAGEASLLPPSGVPEAVQNLVAAQTVRKAALWETPLLKQLKVGELLQGLGVELVTPKEGKRALAGCDLGVTEADFALPETGTLVLRSSEEKPRAVSLLPRIHLAILTPAALRADMHQVFAEAKDSPYLVFITGPSRTSDIELTVTLGVHGPKQLVVLMVD
jgi:L-lactate dehydrogenase complex protein LldG